MITADSLKTYTLKDLAQMAKKKGVTGWHSMRKAQLVRALVRAAKAKSSKSVSRTAAKLKSTKSAPSRRANGTKASPKTRRPSSGKLSPVKSKSSSSNGKSLKTKTAAKPSRVARRIQKINAHHEQMKDLASQKPSKRFQEGDLKDRVVLMVRDPFWLHACWDVSRQSVDRAKAAMAEHWHTAKPILRLIEVEGGSTTSTAEAFVRDIVIHGGVKNWYIDVIDPPKHYRVDLGYLAGNGRFYVLFRSNVVSTPKAGSKDALDENWTDIAEDYEKVYSLSGGHSEENRKGDLQELFEERLRRPMGSPVDTNFGIGAERALKRNINLPFEVDAEMILYGSTRSDAHVTLRGEPIKLRSDGTFTVRLSMPDKRQVLPVVASSKDGVEQRTIVLAIERNTKTMEPIFHDSNR